MDIAMDVMMNTNRNEIVRTFTYYCENGNINGVLRINGDHKITPIEFRAGFHLACANNHREVLKYLTNHYKMCVTLANTVACMQYVIKNGYLGATQFFVETFKPMASFEIKRQSHYNVNTMMYSTFAYQHNHIEIGDWLVERYNTNYLGDDIDLALKACNLRVAEHIAAKFKLTRRELVSRDYKLLRGIINATPDVWDFIVREFDITEDDISEAKAAAAFHGSAILIKTD